MPWPYTTGGRAEMMEPLATHTTGGRAEMMEPLATHLHSPLPLLFFTQPLGHRAVPKGTSKAKHTLSRGAHTLGGGQISPPCFRSLISSSDGVLGKTLPR